jgi:hypothetical protein
MSGSRFTARKWPIVACFAALALAAAACGGSSSASSQPPTTRGPSSSNQPANPPGAFGTVAAVSGSSLEVQNPTNGQVTVNVTPTTTIRQTVSGTAADLVPGVCVAANAGQGTTATPGQPFTARSVAISQPGANGCTAGPGGGFGGGNGPRAGSANGNRNGNRMGRFAGAFGKVTSVSAPTFVVQRTDRNGANTTTTVTTDSSTTFSKVVTASQSALAVGQCVTAVGPADQTGAVTANSITIRPPGPNGCVVGNRGGQGGGNGGPPSTT